MPKMRTNRAAAKRFKRTGTGKIKRAKAYARHHLGLKSRKRKRRLHEPALIEPTERRRLQKLLPYGA
ncbi:MAG: 50S ribosomal protein L35 [Candidatus Eisenbacteria bacterium]|jgi:large subunit ribosomal protein L35|uniref:Large ribosomal subunit protein bL35 n=1 Tax=Eiseniibacteriota bacterium TaxID=2212470 RepID=A0A538TQ98_UNCEI|nr:MAG: 50S ribosomal protein L35 [Candidatus Eisenbacteria bacterium]